jgi:hypothetical protein
MHRTLQFAVSLSLLALAQGISLAQNCANTSIGVTPLDELGAADYQGFVGGLYPGGSNARPIAHEVAGLAQASGVVPRDAQGNPDPNGSVALLTIGMSNTSIHSNAWRQAVLADPSRDAHFVLVNGAQGGIPAEAMDAAGDPYWVSVLPGKLAQAGITAAQVQVAWLLQTNAGPTTPFPQFALELTDTLERIVQIARAQFPNLRILYLGNRIYAGYSTTSLNPEPYAFEQGFANKWLIERQLLGAPQLNFDPAHGAVLAPWLAWGPYTWADGLTPRSDGLTWTCPDFNPDGTHPSAFGAQKYAAYLLGFLQTDSSARAWYLAQPQPVIFGTGKLTSLGSLPTVGYVGAASLAAQNLKLTLAAAVPNKVCIGLRSPRPGLQAFFGGTLWLAPPIVRLPPRLTDAQGRAFYNLPITPSQVGTSEHFMFWFRDGQHPDQTGTGMSNALAIRYAP